MAAGSEIGGGGEIRPIPGMRRSSREPDRQMRFVDPGRADEQHIRRCLQVSAGRELVDELAIDTRLRRRSRSPRAMPASANTRTAVVRSTGVPRWPRLRSTATDPTPRSSTVPPLLLGRGPRATLRRRRAASGPPDAHADVDRLAASAVFGAGNRSPVFLSAIRGCSFRGRPVRRSTGRRRSRLRCRILLQH